jgi:tetratricopeptide (TPR) repeat protein
VRHGLPPTWRRVIAFPAALFAAVSAPAQAPDPDAYYRAGLDFRQKGDCAQAVSYLGYALQLKPGLPGAWTSIAYCQEVLGRPAEARDAYAKALQADPNDAYARQRLEALGGAAAAAPRTEGPRPVTLEGINVEIASSCEYVVYFNGVAGEPDGRGGTGSYTHRKTLDGENLTTATTLGFMQTETQAPGGRMLLSYAVRAYQGEKEVFLLSSEASEHLAWYDRDGTQPPPKDGAGREWHQPGYEPGPGWIKGEKVQKVDPPIEGLREVEFEARRMKFLTAAPGGRSEAQGGRQYFLRRLKAGP